MQTLRQQFALTDGFGFTSVEQPSDEDGGNESPQSILHDSKLCLKETVGGMFRDLVASAYKRHSEVTQHRSPGKIAIGLALGTSLGLIPLDNLVWFVLLMGILFLPVHQVAGVSAWVVTSVLSSQLSVVPDALGDWLLSMEWVQGCVRQFQVIPAAAWFRLNNTLVVGSLALGLVSLIPSWLVLRVLGGNPQQQKSDRVDDFSEVEKVYRKSVSSPPRNATMSQPPTTQLPIGESSEPVASIRFDSADSGSHPVSSEDDSETDSVTIRETFIEVIRLRAPQPTPFSPMNDRREAMIAESKKPIASISISHTEGDREEEFLALQGKDSLLTRFSPAHQQLSGPKSSNSLRFLLRHLTSHRSEPGDPEPQA